MFGNVNCSCVLVVLVGRFCLLLLIFRHVLEDLLCMMRRAWSMGMVV